MPDVNLNRLKITSLKEYNERFKIYKQKVGGDFFCGSNLITDLVGSPRNINGSAIFWFNSHLVSIAGAPNYIRGSLNLSNCPMLKNLKGIHKEFKGGGIGNMIIINDNALRSHVLGVILIPHLTRVSIDRLHRNVKEEELLLNDILNKHIGNDVLECQEELIQNGFKEFAQL